MAQVKTWLVALALTAFVLTGATPGTAQEPAVPEAGLAAEAAGDWDAAIEIYRGVAQSAGRADLWIRISRIQATRDRPAEALAAASRAVELEPRNLEYLRARAELATWAGDYAAAADSYERMAALGGGRETELGLARIAGWRGRIAESIGHYRAYLRAVPGDSVATIELARQETWRGNARGALAVLDGYRERFGETRDWRIERARALTTGNRPRAALDVVRPVIEATPDHYEARLVHTLALAEAGRRDLALGSLDTLAGLDPGNARTAETRAWVRAPIRTSLRPRFEFYDDSDAVQHYLFGLDAAVALSPMARVVATVSTTDVHSEPGSGLAPVSGEDEIREAGGDIGLVGNFGGVLELEGRLGGRRVEDDGPETFTWLAAARLTPSDRVGLVLEGQRTLLDVSARSLDLGIKRTGARARLRVSPAIGWTIETGGSRDSYSDDNGRWEANLVVTDGVLRRQLVNLDVGLASRWIWFDEDLDNGYYDPGRYEQHLAVLSTYWKLSDQAGLSLRGAVGAFKDDAIRSFERSIETAGEATFGITTDWSLVARAAWLDNVRSVTGAFNAVGAGIYLTRRF